MGGPDTLAFTLSYAGTLAFALVLFLVQAAAFTALMVFAGSARFLFHFLAPALRLGKERTPNAG